ncbi:MAG: hypothetical protein NTY61_00435, partial [Candidatus Parcubacteria bacterium]|nr:hypothetical protein [Candidatus Parcubacteria bacterium]
KWESLGWVYHEAVGTRMEGAVYLSHESSMTPRSFMAFSTSTGGPTEFKEYKIIKGGMLVVTMGREKQGCFSLVFTRFPDNAEQAVSSDGHKPSIHASSADPAAPADAH